MKTLNWQKDQKTETRNIVLKKQTVVHNLDEYSNITIIKSKVNFENGHTRDFQGS